MQQHRTDQWPCCQQSFRVSLLCVFGTESISSRLKSGCLACNSMIRFSGFLVGVHDWILSCHSTQRICPSRVGPTLLLALTPCMRLQQNGSPRGMGSWCLQVWMLSWPCRSKAPWLRGVLGVLVCGFTVCWWAPGGVHVHSSMHGPPLPQQ